MYSFHPKFFIFAGRKYLLKQLSEWTSIDDAVSNEKQMQTLAYMYIADTAQRNSELFVHYVAEGGEKMWSSKQSWFVVLFNSTFHLHFISFRIGW